MSNNAVVKNDSILQKALPLLDEAVDKSHCVDELITIAITSVVSVVVTSVVSNIFKK